jgi:hypothetical protein
MEGPIMRKSTISFLSLLSLCLPALGSAQKPPLGPPEQANTFSAGNQGYQMDCAYYERRQHDVASDEDGNFVVVWSGQYDGGGYYGAVFGQRFDRFGFKKGGEFRVSDPLGEYVSSGTPSIGMAADGGFVVAWTSYEYAEEIKAQRFDAAANPLGPEFRVSENGVTISYPGYSYTLPQYYGLRNADVAMNGDGRFVVVWQREGELETALGDPDPLGDADRRQIAGRLFSASASPQGAAFKVNDGSDEGQEFYWNAMPDGAIDDGGFVVTWRAQDGNYGGEAVLGHRFDALGGSLGGEFRVSAHAYGNYFEANPTVAKTSAGGFVVVWASSSIEPVPFGDRMDIAARVFDAAGGPTTSAFTVNETNAYKECGPRIARFADASFVVSWHHHYGGDGEYEAFGRLLDASGNPSGSEFLLSDDPDMVHQATAVAPQGNDFVVAWAARPDEGDYFDVFVRRFGDTAVPSCSPAPLPGCRQTTRSRAGVLRWKQNLARPAQNTLTWSFTKGALTAPADFGDPVEDTSYVFCVYDASVNPQPLATMVAPGGTKCGTFPCWFELPATGLMYTDNAGEIHGVTQVRLTPGAEGRTRIGIKGRGANLPLPAVPLTGPVVAQLQATNGECWSATYDQFITKNSDGKFTAKPTAP